MFLPLRELIDRMHLSIGTKESSSEVSGGLWLVMAGNWRLHSESRQPQARVVTAKQPGNAGVRASIHHNNHHLNLSRPFI